MNKTTEALELAEALENDAKEHREVSYGLDCPPERTANWKHALNCEAAARLIREALAEPVKQEPVATVNANDEGYWMMLTGGKLGEASCAHCNRSLGAAITCHHCGYINSHVDSVYTPPEDVEKTAKSIHDKSTNLCQNSTELVETDKSKMRHRYAGSFGG